MADTVIDSAIFADLQEAAGADFVIRVGAAAHRALASPLPDSVQIIVASDAKALTFEFDTDIVSVMHTA